MNKLTKLLIPALAASLALGAAVPASAATFVGNAGSVKVELNQLGRQIDVARAHNQLTRQEAANLNARVDRVQNLYRTYARGGFSRAELLSLDNRVDNMKRAFARKVNDRGHSGHFGEFGHRR